jgi:hypothetical protein
MKPRRTRQRYYTLSYTHIEEFWWRVKPYHTGEGKVEQDNLRCAQHLDPTVNDLQWLCPVQ